MCRNLTRRNFIKTCSTAAAATMVGAPAGEAAVMAKRHAATKPVSIFLDTDVVADPGDPIAIALLQGLADLGEARILAITCVTSNPYAAGCVDAIDRFYGRPNIPIGQLKNKILENDSLYSRIIARKYPNRYPDGTAHVPDAVTIFRQVVSRQPDHSVVIAGIGPFTNLRDYLQSPPDQYSPLNGRDLIAGKVKLLSQMAGKFPSGSNEFNIAQDPEAAQYVTEHWPTPIMFSGFEIGAGIITGGDIKTGPVHDALRHFYGNTTRPAWDETAVLFAVRGARNYWNVKTNGYVQIIVNTSGTIWHPLPHRGQGYLIRKMPDQELGKIIMGIEAVAGRHASRVP
ncbi:MAG: nucleoside hydrolase [Phycisphaerae bacterium]